LRFISEVRLLKKLEILKIKVGHLLMVMVVKTLQ
jgi:hypothetical protein